MLDTLEKRRLGEPTKNEIICNQNLRISSKFTSGLFWTNLSGIITALFRFVGGIYLARKIDPAVFGQQSIIVATLIIFWSFVTIGEIQAIIRQQEHN